MMACLSAVLTPLVGSSSRMISGRSAKARGDVEELLVALGQLRARARGALSASPNSAATSSASAWTWRSPASEAKSRAPRPSRETTAAWSVSSTVSSGKIVDELEAPRHAEPRERDRPDAADVLALEAHGARARLERRRSAR